MSTVIERVVEYKFGKKLSKDEEIKLAFDYCISSGIGATSSMPAFMYDVMREMSFRDIVMHVKRVSKPLVKRKPAKKASTKHIKRVRNRTTKHLKKAK